VADGTILAEFAAPAFVSWAKEQIAGGQHTVGRTESHRLTVFAFTCVDPVAAIARQQLRPLIASAIASGKIDAQIEPLGILPRVRNLLEKGGQSHLAAEMPDEWVDELAIAGPPADCRRAMHRLVEAGADTVVLVPLPDKGLDELDVFARYLL
jgi:alkanesulfonate monooxygenase SsuD/methylene tetrahydromethanopterin reductase-like flavin-dependent oxidoreductase (luciferase family)